MFNSLFLSFDLNQFYNFMSDWIFLLVAIPAIIISGIVAIEFDRIAASKGYPEKRWFWYCFLFGIAGWLMVVALPDKNKRL